MKKLFIPCIMLISTQISFAQDSKLWLSVGAGLDNTPGAEKDHATGRGFNVQADAFVPFYRKGWDGTVKGSRFTLGVNISGNYTGIRNQQPDNTDIAGRYQVYQGNVVITDQSEGKISGGFSGLAGIQARIDLGKFNLAPSVNFGYLHFKQKGYTQTGSLRVNEQTQQKDLVKSAQQSTNGFVLKPQLKIGYDIANNFSLFISPSMVFGPVTRYTTYYLVPQGGFNDKNTYETSQLAKGTMESSTLKGRYRLMEINAGITVAIGKRQSTVKQTQGMNFGEKVTQRAAANNGNNPLYEGNAASGQNPMYEANKTGGNNPLYEGNTASGVSPMYNPAGRAMPGTPIGGVIVKGGKNPGGSYITILSDSNGDILLDNLEAGSYLFRLSSPELPAEKSINEKEIKPAEDAAIARPGTPIGGIIVKGGKNPGGQMLTTTTNENGEFSFDVTEPGNYVFKIFNPAESGKGIQEAGVRGMAKSGGAVSSSYAAAGRVAGGPLKGIDVKLGKSPNDGIRARAVTNKKGEIEFKGLEPGIYEMIPDLLQKAQAQDFNTTRSNRERGQLAADPGSGSPKNDDLQKAEAQDFNTTRNNRERGQLAARPGGPIGGIIVKGGKNPGGAMTNLAIDDDGTIRFEVLEKGNYKFIFSNRQETQGIVNTTKSNTKD
ncbi:MAG: hypothetical protein KIT80_12095 [Chitinophagaceae bacterium]|nr:hypothetical protein [Chitinophagaceae bacterium]MCW5927644.1 hypothetical protein [Chitinophagaceae bacterium]